MNWTYRRRQQSILWGRADGSPRAVLAVRINESHKQALDAKALSLGKTLSAYAAELLVAAVEESKPTAKEQPKKGAKSKSTR